MKNKYRKSLVIFYCVFFIFANNSYTPEFNVLSESTVGKCFSSIDEYLIKNFGSEYKNDENIKITNLIQENSGKKYSDQYVWVTDTTPSVNITRTLFKITKNGKACSILYVPLSSSVSLKLNKQRKLPLFITSEDSPPPDFSANKIIYRLNINNGTYAPVSCLKVNPKGKSLSIPCNQAFQD